MSADSLVLVLACVALLLSSVECIAGVTDPGCEEGATELAREEACAEGHQVWKKDWLPPFRLLAAALVYRLGLRLALLARRPDSTVVGSGHSTLKMKTTDGIRCTSHGIRCASQAAWAR